jgi:hypothetical protein
MGGEEGEKARYRRKGVQGRVYKGQYRRKEGRKDVRRAVSK